MGKRWLGLLVVLCWAAPAAAQIAPTYVFTAGTIINPDEVNANFNLLQNALNRTGGTMTGTLTTLNVVPTATNVSTLGLTGTRYANVYSVLGNFSGALTASATLGVTGVATFTAQPILSSLTASQAVFTDASKGLVSNAITGTGNVVMSASPTLTGTITAAIANFSGAVGVASLAISTNLTVADSGGGTYLLRNLVNGGTTSFSTNDGTTHTATMGADGLWTFPAGLTVGSGAVGLVNSAGKIPAISATYFASLSGASLTSIPTSAVSSGNFVATVASGTGITSSVTSGNAAATTVSLNATAVSAGSYGSSTSIPSFTVDAQGRLTAAAGNVVIAPAGTLTGTTLASNVVTSSLTTVATVTSGTWSGLFGAVTGANLTNLTAANVTGSHTLPDGVLSTNVPLLNANNTFTNTGITSFGTWSASGSMPTVFAPGTVRTLVAATGTTDKLAGFFGMTSSLNQTSGPQALEAYSYVNQGGTTTLAIAGVSNMEVGGSGITTSARGHQAGVFTSGSGSGTDAIIYEADFVRLSGTTAFTNVYGLKIGTFGAGATNKYSVYSPDNTAELFHSGNILIGASLSTNPIGTDAGALITAGGQVQAGVSGDTTMYLTRLSTTGTIVNFFYNAGSKGTISTDGSTIAYNTSSDARLKADHGVVTSTDVLRRVVIHDYVWKATGQPGRGVFAQDAYKVIPLAVSVGDDTTDKNGALLHPWGVDYSKFVPDLIVGWQQDDDRLEKDEADIAALKAALRIH